MTNTKELALVKSENFGAVQCDFWQGNNSEVFMTREQIGRALDYSNPKKAIEKIHFNHKSRLDTFSMLAKVSPAAGDTLKNSQNTTVYSSKGVMEICRWSQQPKADAFMDWVWDVVDGLRTGQLQVTNGCATMSPDVIESKIQNMLDSKFLSLEALVQDYEHKTDKRMNEMANSFTYIQKSLEDRGTVRQLESVVPTSWKSSAIEKIKRLVISKPDEYRSINSVLRKIYARMRNVYGIVFEQELKEYAEKYDNSGKPSTLELVNQKEVLRKLFDGILLDMGSDSNITGPTDKFIMPVAKTPKQIIRETMAPLIEKYNDSSNGGNATYQKVYKEMNVGWQNRQTRYMNQHQLTNRPSKFRLVETDDKLRRMFVKTVDSMLGNNCE